MQTCEEKNVTYADIPKEPEEDEDDEKSEDGHLMEGDWAKLLLLLLQHPSDCIFVPKIQGVASEKMQCEILLHSHIEAMMDVFNTCNFSWT